MISLPNKHHSSPGGQGGSSTPTRGGKTRHLPSLLAPRVTQKAGSQGLWKGVFLSQDMLGSAYKLLVQASCLGLQWDCLFYPRVCVVLPLESTRSLPSCDEGVLTSNNSAGMLRVCILFGKPRARITTVLPSLFRC